MNDRLQSLINKGYDPELVSKLSSFTSEDISESVQFLMLKAIGDAKPSNAPQVYFIGGQPGSGKSSAMDRISDSLENGIVTVEMDTYRNMFNKVNEIKKVIYDFYKNSQIDDKELQQSDDFIAFTQGFADAVADNFTVQLFNNGYNMMIESTLRHPNSKLEMARQMREANTNAKISVIMMGVSHDIAWQGALDRANIMKTCMDKLRIDGKIMNIDVEAISRGGIQKERFDSICNDLAKSTKTLSSPAYSYVINGNVEIQDRNGNILYDRNRDGFSVDPMVIEESSLYGELAQKQNEEFISQGKNYNAIKAFIKENETVVKDVYGTLENAKEVFEKEVNKVNDAIAEQANILMQVKTLENMSLNDNEYNGKRV